MMNSFEMDRDQFAILSFSFLSNSCRSFIQSLLKVIRPNPRSIKTKEAAEKLAAKTICLASRRL